MFRTGPAAKTPAEGSLSAERTLGRARDDEEPRRTEFGQQGRYFVLALAVGCSRALLRPGAYEPTVQARVLTPIAFHALIVTIRLTRAAISSALNSAATAS
jgi:hypothetical protein